MKDHEKPDVFFLSYESTYECMKNVKKITEICDDCISAIIKDI